MDGSNPLKDRRASRRSAPPEVWDQVREDFLSGVPGQECCRRHGVGLSTLKRRAAAEGWRHADQPWPELQHGLDPDDEGLALEEAVSGDLDYVDLYDLAYVALRRMKRAVLRGDSIAALRWRRVRQVMEEEDRELQRKRLLYQRDQSDREAAADGPARG